MKRLVGVLVFIYSMAAFAIDPKGHDYFPGQNGLTWDEYYSLIRAFSRARSKDTPDNVVEKNALFNDKVEIEALHSLLRLLSDKSSRVYYAGFQDYGAAVDPEGEIQTNDGLFGFKVVRQLEVLDTNKKPRLISAIFSYQFDTSTQRFNLRAGADVIRVRFEVEPFQLVIREEKERPLARGMAAFSWITEANSQGNVKSIRSAPYTKIYSEPLKETDPDYLRKKRGFGFKPYSPCSLPDHCMACHHAENRTVFTSKIFERFKKAPLESEAVSDFLTHAKQDLKLSETVLDNLTRLLNEPNKAFPPEEIEALVFHRLKIKSP